MMVPKLLIEWCETMFEPRQNPLAGHSAYGMKHIFQKDTGEYVTEEVFTEAMIRCGYNSVMTNGMPYLFCVSKKSEAFDWRARRGLPTGWYMNPDLTEVFQQERGKRK